MNERLKMFLEEIDEEDAEEIWRWLFDGNPNAINELIETIAKRLPDWRKKNNAR